MGGWNAAFWLLMAGVLLLFVLAGLAAIAANLFSLIVGWALALTRRLCRD